MLFDFLSNSDARVPHILTSAILADFQVRIAVEFRDMRGRNATFPVQSIDILTHDVLQMVPLCQLNHRHVCFRRVRLLDRSS